MMKKIIFLGMCSLSLVACSEKNEGKANDEKKSEEKQPAKEEPAKPSAPAEDPAQPEPPAPAAPEEPEAPTAEETVTPDPTLEPEPEKAPADNDFIGLTKEEAKVLAEKWKIACRVVMEDGESFPVTLDFREDRLNFSVEKGKIVKVTRG